MSKKITIVDVEKYVKENTKLILLSKEYKGQLEPLRFICTCGEEFETTFKYLKRGKHQCNHCGHTMNQPLQYSYEEVKNIVESKGLKLLSDKYVNTKSKLTFLCECGRRFETTFESINLDGKCKCNYCVKNFGGGSSKDEIFDYMNSRVKEVSNNEYEILKDSYKNSNSKCKIKCNKCNTIFECSPANIITNYRGCNCDKCSCGERAIRWFLDKNNISYIKEFNYEGLISDKTGRKLYLDFYLDSLKIAIEYDGPQHFKDSNSIMYKENSSYNDSFKNEFCKNNNIKLIRIGYKDFYNIETQLNSMLIMSEDSNNE